LPGWGGWWLEMWEVEIEIEIEMEVWKVVVLLEGLL
jgi:hypothetical protein